MRCSCTAVIRRGDPAHFFLERRGVRLPAARRGRQAATLAAAESVRGSAIDRTTKSDHAPRQVVS